MIARIFFLLFLVVSLEAAENTDSLERVGKAFSLFNVVTFKNFPCQSESGTTRSSGINRNGTCYTSTECTDKGGASSGNCASGFGVCCLFIVTEAGGTVSENCSYIQNPSFPAVYAETTSLKYTINKCASDVCYMRLDFETMTLLGPVNTVEDADAICQDSFIAKGSASGFTTPTICGKNAGQHLYIDVGPTESATATIDFTFGAASTIRTWEIKVTQIQCTSQSRPLDPGCLQYFTGTTGRISTFNFQETTLMQHLPNQNYNICIRQEEGFCCVRYSLCGDARSWSIDTTAAAETEIGSLCSHDFVGISGVSQTCNRDNNLNLSNRICGGKFGATTLGVVDSASVCSCNAPFTLQIVTDLTNDGTAPAAATEARGACLQYEQVAC